MKTRGEIEAAICEVIRRFQLEHMGRGPTDIRAHLIGDLLVVRLQGVLTAAGYHYLTFAYDPTVRHPVGIDPRPDIEKILDSIARESSILHEPERNPLAR